MNELNERDQKVLDAVISGYLKSGDPVGSRTVSKNYGGKVSSATIRNVMADLEEMGLLQQPHTSAGRIPTDRGLRLYLDSIIQLEQLDQKQRQLIRGAYEQTSGAIEDLLCRTSKVLSVFCRQAGVVLWPKFEATVFKHIEFIRLTPRQIMVILISKSGLVEHSVIDWGEVISQETLDKYSDQVNELLKDLPLGEVKARILKQMKDAKATFDQLFTKTLNIAQQALQTTLDNSNIYIEGQTNLLNSPEFSDVGRMRKLLQAFEDKSRLIRLLDTALNPGGRVQIILGSESEVRELEEVSLISSTYSRGETALGVLGVIGPLRMDYSRIIPIVDFTARSLSNLLAEERN